VISLRHGCGASAITPVASRWGMALAESLCYSWEIFFGRCKSSRRELIIIKGVRRAAPKELKALGEWWWMFLFLPTRLEEKLMISGWEGWGGNGWFDYELNAMTSRLSALLGLSVSTYPLS